MQQINPAMNDARRAYRNNGTTRSSCRWNNSLNSSKNKGTKKITNPNNPNCTNIPRKELCTYSPLCARKTTFFKAKSLSSTPKPYPKIGFSRNRFTATIQASILPPKIDKLSTRIYLLKKCFADVSINQIKTKIKDIQEKKTAGVWFFFLCVFI